MITRLQNYISTFRRADQKQFKYVRPSKRSVERVVRAVIVKHKEALKELSAR